MAFCRSCGVVLQEGSQFCQACGTAINIDSGLNHQPSTAIYQQSMQNEMNLVSAFTRVVFENYANFKGRASKAEFWWYILASLLLGALAGVIGAILKTEAINALLNIALFLPGIAVTVRRLHDTNRSGWWYLLVLTIIGLIPLLIWFIQKSDQQENRFGAVPAM